MAPSSADGGAALEARRPKSVHTAAVKFEGNGNGNGSSPDGGNRRFQLEVSECVETKTVTTTTRLTRKFPQVFVRDPAPLQQLDSKEYPLAMKPTPPELLAFSYKVQEDCEPEQVQQQIQSVPYEEPVDDDDDVYGSIVTPLQSQAEKSTPKPPPTATEPSSPRSRRDTPSSAPSGRRVSRSPTEAYSLRTRQSKTSRAGLPNASTELPSAKHTQRNSRSIQPNTASDRLRRSVTYGGGTSAATRASGSRGNSSSGPREAGDRPVRSMTPGFLATPDVSELAGSGPERSSRHGSLHLDLPRNPTSASDAGLYDAASLAGSDSHTVFSNVATPPITDNDPQSLLDDDESLQHSIRDFHSRPSTDVAAAQDASLPSPRLSPNLAAAQLHPTDEDVDTPVSLGSTGSQSLAIVDGGAEILPLRQRSANSRALTRRTNNDEPVIVDTQTLLDTFDSMKTEMKTFMMYQFLRRCARPTLRVVANAVNPALKCDFLRQLPLELGYYVLSHLNHRDLCRAARVSKHWRSIVDRNETGWKELLDGDGYALAPGELNKAIVQGWGWQDPVGAAGFEKDISLQHRYSNQIGQPDPEFMLKAEQQVSTLRSSKRKRGPNVYKDRPKRRAGAQEAGLLRLVRGGGQEVGLNKAEGPLSAANAAAIAISNPCVGGLDSLRELHLFKSLYRRHHMIRHSWMNGEVKPKHVAFAAHPRHVITCLQFDDDKIITGSDDQLIHIYDTKTGKLRKKLEGHDGGVWALQYEGNMLVSGSTDRSVRVWDMERGLCQQVFYGHTSTVRCLQILMPSETGRDANNRPIMQPEKPLIITGSRDSQLRVWRLPEVGSRRYVQTGPPEVESDCPYFIRTLGGHTHSVRAISAHGDTLVSGSYDSTVRVWRISSGESRYVLTGHSQKVYSVVLDHKRNRCISGSMDSLVKIWDLADGSCTFTLEGHSLLVGLLDLRDERLVSAAADSTLRIWDPENGKCRNTLMAHTGAITCFQHDGQKVISGSEKTVKMWDVRTGECVQDLLTDLSGVWQVKFDGRRCVAAVQRDSLTYVEILDFGAVRDGVPPDQLGKRILLNEPEVRAMIAEET